MPDEPVAAPAPRRILMETVDGDYAEIRGDYSVRYKPVHGFWVRAFEPVPPVAAATACHGASRAPRARSRRVRSSSSSDDPGEPPQQRPRERPTIHELSAEAALTPAEVRAALRKLLYDQAVARVARLSQLRECPGCLLEYDRGEFRGGYCPACRTDYMRDYMRRYRSESRVA